MLWWRDKDMKNNESAVSPVVGVMLMLVVTIIIAAVVSAFAGGMGGNAETLHTAQIKATYSQQTGIEIDNLGGDALPTITTSILIYPTKTFGNAEHMVWTVNKSSITGVKTDLTKDLDGDGELGESAWLRQGGLTGSKSFNPGDTHFIEPPYHTRDFLQPGASATYAFDSSANIGKTFWIELVDDSGRTIGKTEVTITP